MRTTTYWSVICSVNKLVGCKTWPWYVLGFIEISKFHFLYHGCLCTLIIIIIMVICALQDSFIFQLLTLLSKAVLLYPCRVVPNAPRTWINQSWHSCWYTEWKLFSPGGQMPWKQKFHVLPHLCMYNSPVWKVTYTCLNSKVFLFDFFLASLISVALAGSAYFNKIQITQDFLLQILRSKMWPLGSWGYQWGLATAT